MDDKKKFTKIVSYNNDKYKAEVCNYDGMKYLVNDYNKNGSKKKNHKKIDLIQLDQNFLEDEKFFDGEIKYIILTDSGSDVIGHSEPVILKYETEESVMKMVVPFYLYGNFRNFFKDLAKRYDCVKTQSDDEYHFSVVDNNINIIKSDLPLELPISNKKNFQLDLIKIKNNIQSDYHNCFPLAFSFLKRMTVEEAENLLSEKTEYTEAMARYAQRRVEPIIEKIPILKTGEKSEDYRAKHVDKEKKWNVRLEEKRKKLVDKLNQL